MMSTPTDPRPGLTVSPVAAFALSTAMASVAATAVAFLLTSADGTPAPVACECSCDTPAALVPDVPPSTAMQALPVSDLAVAPAPPLPPAMSSAPPQVPDVPAPPRIRQAKAEVGEGLDAGIIRRIVRAHINEVRYCYNEGLQRNPKLEGRVAVQFRVDASGSVDKASAQSSTLGDAAVEDCIVGAVERWKFPKPKDGKPVTVTYPFVLSPG